MGAPDLLAQLSALGVKLSREGDALIAEPRSALTDEARAMIRAHKAELLAAFESPAKGVLHSAGADPAAEARIAHALAFLEMHPNVRRACFANVEGDPAHVIITVAIREPRVAVEVLVRRERLDVPALMELSLRYPDTSLFVPLHQGLPAYDRRPVTDEIAIQRIVTGPCEKSEASVR
jgi:hypothetical protein